ncbi:hypothetical protein LPJ38_34960 [Bradyrhizobium daqingense]|uniref:DUF6036 domain-containing protein n=1 Tax=Bradyrhizobium daqingense TaxID=993502 RepID=A0A562L330_9BRAD|nr:DUF6036 family nucleotidyltransferase [Bradyrhizobium daqingense]TWI02067.1 hypothetical protein IQ17_04427 [Bradyrhizobium daqingense]UFS88765.1 hypothetical protein LPJ38_34960 [Bradyrhizobium daqingense]
MSNGGSLRTFEDLLRAVRALAYEFETDTVFVVGSQAILASMPDAPEVARQSPEIDAFPANAKIWELTEAKRTRDGVQPVASEHIDGLFGSESPFHRAHGFYIDGVDETTARLPKGWQGRAVSVRTEVAGRTVTGVAPAPEDLVVSKLARLDERDKRFVAAIHAKRPLDLALVERRVYETDLDPAVAERAVAYIKSLKSGR